MQNLRKGSRFLSDYAGIVSQLSETNPNAAENFCEAVERALKLIATHPQLGAKAGYSHAPNVRKWIVQPFRNYLLFYQPTDDDGVLAIRLLHAARDLPPLIPNE